MFQKILLATSDNHLREALSFYLEDWKKGVDLNPADHAEMVDQKLKGEAWLNFDLIIVDHNLRLNRTVPRGQDTGRGLALLQDLYKRGAVLPSILIVHDVDVNLFYETQRLIYCELACTDKSLDEGVELAIKRLSNLTKSINPEKPSSTAIIEIDLSSAYNPGPNYRIRYQSGGEENSFATRTKPLEVDWKNIEELRDISKSLSESKDTWKPLLKRIGRDLFNELLRSSEFFKDFKKVQDTNISPENLFIRISVSHNIYEIACEALYDDSIDDSSDDSRGFLMLNVPVTRRVTCDQKRDPLFSGSHNNTDPINILFIEADVHGFVPALDNSSFEKLNNIAKERQYFERYQKGEIKKRKANIGTICILSPEKEGADFKDTVESYLTGTTKNREVPNKFHIVHFAGHSVFDNENKDGGFLIFPGDPPKKVSVREFAEWLGKADTRLAYLSSCKSSDAEVAFELANRGVPTVVGFRWDLEDKYAAEYSQAFFDELLLKDLSLERAFLKARRAMNFQHKEDRIWAAPTMIHQVQM